MEERFAERLQVIGVHSAKFTNEKGTGEIRAAMARYGVRHPVVNDRDFRVWREYAARAWPTLVLIDPLGYVVFAAAGEQKGELLGALIAGGLDHFGGDLPAIQAVPAFSPGTAAGPLAFPGKVAYDPVHRLLAVAETAGHRVILAGEDGVVLKTAGGGRPGAADGSLEAARFNEPQGMAFYRGDLLVADRANHLIRRIDFEAGRVSTVAGDGGKEFGPDRSGPARELSLNSPWDVEVAGGDVFVAMAGNHQIWRFHPESGTIGPFAGTGEENIRDGALNRTLFAQPTGLAWDGAGSLYVADSETSAVRRIDLERERVETLVGTGLFDFGDRLGSFEHTLLQHPQDVAWLDGRLLVADSYNHRIVELDPGERKARLTAGGLHEPAGLAAAGDRLVVADTNAGRIVSVTGGGVEEIVLHWHGEGR